MSLENINGPDVHALGSPVVHEVVDRPDLHLDVAPAAFTAAPEQPGPQPLRDEGRIPAPTFTSKMAGRHDLDPAGTDMSWLDPSKNETPPQ